MSFFIKKPYFCKKHINMVAVQAKSSLAKKDTSKKISWETFEEEYLSREDGYKYEWVDGYVEKIQTNMNKDQLYLIINIQQFFKNLDRKFPIDGTFVCEIDTFFDGQHRKPNMAFVTFDQAKKAKNGGDLVPKFIIEIISNTDQVNRLQKKMDDYDRANVEVVWHVFPLLEKVHVYNGNKMTVCRTKDICSAESVIKGFKMTVKEIFT